MATLYPSTAQLTVRLAQASDLDDIVSVALAAMPMDPQWDYRFPRRQIYPEDTRDFTFLKYQDFLRSPQQWQIVLVEAPVPAEAPVIGPALASQRGHVVAFSIWEVSNLPPERRAPPVPVGRPSLCVGRGRRDADERRLAAWNSEMPRAKVAYFNNVYGSQHLHLQVLATHPEWQRRGAGTMLCRWGLSIAEASGMAVSVFASPMGRRLYEKLGFTLTGKVDICVPGEELEITVAALVFEPASLHQRLIVPIAPIKDVPLPPNSLITVFA